MAQSAAQRAEEERVRWLEDYWPEEKEHNFWGRRQKTKGFQKIPRSMPYIALLLDEHSSKKPLYKTYIALWCRVFKPETPVMKITNVDSLVFESGFAGQRARSTWEGRMKILEELGFIKSHAGTTGKYTYVLLLNPHEVIDKLINEGTFNKTMTYEAYVDRYRETEKRGG